MDNLWFQNYDPFHNSGLSTIVAALPVVVLLGSIAVFKIRIHFSALLGLGVALMIALAVYRMPVKAAAATAASGLSLIANTAPVAFGALGTPIIALSKVTGLSEVALSQMVGRQLPFFSLLVPFWVVWAMAGFHGMLGIWPAALTAGLAFAIPQFLISNFHGPWLVDIVASVCFMAATVALLKFWQPAEKWKLSDDPVP